MQQLQDVYKNVRIKRKILFIKVWYSLNVFSYYIKQNKNLKCVNSLILKSDLFDSKHLFISENDKIK